VTWIRETREFFHAFFVNGSVLKKYRSVRENPTYGCCRRDDEPPRHIGTYTGHEQQGHCEPE
jgi:hypothetical protein